MWMPKPLIDRVALASCLAPLAATAAVYEVGDGRPFATIGAVAWESLEPGDTVLIYWRAAPYQEKWVIGRTGTATRPITVHGVPGPSGQLPVIDGDGASTRPQLNYWNEVRSVLKVGGSNTPSDCTPRYVIVENLDIRSGRPPYTFTAAGGVVRAYVNNAAAIHIEKGEHITIRNCHLHDCGNGIFVSSSDTTVSRDILVEGNNIDDNGNEGSIYEHNNYTAAIGITFQYNRFGPLRGTASGNNLKDRSAGLVVRYNWIEGGNRQLDLVDAEDSAVIRADPAYHTTFVYGNVLVEPAGAGNRQITHYGGDSGTTAAYRKGTLYFYHNTVVSTRPDRTTLFRLSTNEEQCDARNNIFYVTAAGGTLSLLDAAGALDLSRNWFKPGWVSSFGTLTGQIRDDQTAVTGASPGLLEETTQDYRPARNAACIDQAAPLPAAVLPTHGIVSQYVRHQAGQSRQVFGAAPDLGAFEHLTPDLDGDGNVERSDLILFAACVSGPDRAHSGNPTCTQADLDRDGDVDQSDFGFFQRYYRGANAPSAPNSANAKHGFQSEFAFFELRPSRPGP
ncbi:MAG TPA: NosD domain-containing protein [Phycisphaerae bacterium]|nr:NosD domain-containing protein [Phycisphaerae bacterium]HRY69496.1 NosD domain-containing protein [Phycisphaerae bacterium]HSA28200.1 NosD domain-containing protein [Phycisphaerae bacterium]